MHTRSMMNWPMTVVAAAAATLVTGCGGGYSNPPAGTPANEVLQVVMTSDQEVLQPVVSAATATATLTLDRATRTISATIAVDGFVATGAQILTGEAGAEGPATFPMTIAGNMATLAPTVLTGEQLATLDAGRFYLNVNSAKRPNGEVRGQIGREVFAAHLTGSQLSTPVESAGDGDGFLVLDPKSHAVAGSVTLHGVEGTTVDVEAAAFGEDGDAVVHMSDSGDHLHFVVPPGVVLKAGDIDKLRAGGFYFNVRNSAHAGGEVRGQIGRRVLLAALDGKHEVPSTGSPATGRGFVLYDSATRKVTGNLSLSDITATKAHIHQGAEGENGDVIVPLSNPSLDGRNWTVSAPTPTLTLDQAGALLTDGMYYNAHSVAFPDGEVRGQLHLATNDAAPVLRIVSPAPGASLARGEGVPGAGTFNGTGFSINLEMITRDRVGIGAREGTNVRDPSLLGGSNPNLPTLEVTFDADLIKPDGTIIPAGTNLAPLFNIAGSDDTPGAGVTLWTGWHVLESFRDETKSVTIKASIIDQSRRVATDVVNYRLLDGHVSGQGLTPKDPGVAGDGVDDPDGPEVTMIAPRPNSSVSTGPLEGLPTAPTNAALMFIQVSALDKTGAGIAINENGEGKADTDRGTIADGSQIAAHGPNRNYSGLFFSFDVPLRLGNGNLVAAGQNLAPLFNIVGSEKATGGVRSTAGWVVGGALVVPPGKTTVTAVARVTDNAGKSGSSTSTFGISTVENGQELTPAP